MPSVLIVDDEANIRRMLARLLEAEGYEAAGAADGAEGVAAIERSEPDVLLLDLALPGADGHEVLGTVRARWPSLPVVMMSGRATLSDAVRATRMGAFHFIEKPLTPEAVLLTVAGALQLRRARDLTRVLSEDLTGGARLVGSSEAMRQTRTLITQVAPTDARVLITGESGTGKELVAAAIHELSTRANAPFVRVNSAAIPRELVESELFGHERGAFTGATDSRRGRFELADGGTLFLDEVADLDADAQAKLLRAVESGTIERVGAERSMRVDVRVIAATNRDLRVEREAGRFREDLYFRLNVVPMPIPPLRERRDDIAELVEHLLARARPRPGVDPPRLGGDALAALQRYDWPGNVRELANVCERMMILYPGRTVGEREVAALAGEASPAEAASLHDRLREYERRLIDEALRAESGNVSATAARLGTDRANLYRRMRRLGLKP